MATPYCGVCQTAYGVGETCRCAELRMIDLDILHHLFPEADPDDGCPCCGTPNRGDYCDRCNERRCTEIMYERASEEDEEELSETED